MRDKWTHGTHALSRIIRDYTIVLASVLDTITIDHKIAITSPVIPEFPDRKFAIFQSQINQEDFDIA